MVNARSSASWSLHSPFEKGGRLEFTKPRVAGDPCARQEHRLIVRALLALLVALTFFLGSPLQAEETKQLSNESVVMMVQAGLGTELVIAKIRQAPTVSFRLEVDDLVALKQQKVPEEIIRAMLDRATASNPQVTPLTVPGGSGGAPNAFESQLEYQRQELGMEVIRVALRTGEQVQPIRILRGELSRVAMGMAAFMDYPGLKARVRTASRRPELLIKSAAPLSGGRYFLAKLDVDDDDGVRSLKISSYKGRLKTMFGNSRTFMEPDHDWVVEWSAEDTGNDVWKVVPAVDLEPGEYGWYADFGSGEQQSGIFDFGVD